MTAAAGGMISLRRRLILVPLAVVVAAICVVMVLMVARAQNRIVAERASAAQLADQLVREAVGNLSLAGGGDPLAELAISVGSLPDLRHVRLFVLPSQEQDYNGFIRAEDRGRGGKAPSWFIRLLRPAHWEKMHEVLSDGRPYGYVLIAAAPDDEIAELWDDMVFLAALLVGLGGVLITLVVWAVGRALGPVGQLAQGLNRLEQGQYRHMLPPFQVAEFRPLGERFNALAMTLDRTQRENRFLIGRMISLQEDERTRLAHDLHDELGPHLFGIKAQAACLADRMDSTADQDAVAGIMASADIMQRINRRILGQLRPVSLDDMGLAGAVDQLMDDWRGRLPGVDWHFRHSDLSPPPDHGRALCLYRITQECLTNAARHSGASRVEVDLESGPVELFRTETGADVYWCIEPDHDLPPDRQIIHLAVRDDGRGLTGQDRQGFGLLGVRERVRAFGGALSMGQDQDGGTVIRVLLPQEQRASD